MKIFVERRYGDCLIIEQKIHNIDINFQLSNLWAACYRSKAWDIDWFSLTTRYYMDRKFGSRLIGLVIHICGFGLWLDLKMKSKH